MASLKLGAAIKFLLGCMLFMVLLGLMGFTWAIAAYTLIGGIG
jgi:hypothetical protein